MRRMCAEKRPLSMNSASAACSTRRPSRKSSALAVDNGSTSSGGTTRYASRSPGYITLLKVPT